MRTAWFVVVLLVGCKSPDDYGKRPGNAQAEWEASKAADKAKSVVLTDRGSEPRRVLGDRDLAVGKTLSAAVEVETTTVIGRAGEPSMTKTSKLRGMLKITMREPKGDEFPGAFEVQNLEGDLKNLSKLKREGSFEPGAFGEPWAAVLQPGGGTGSANEDLVWDHDLKGWLRTVLMPIPQEPVGVGATWFGEWTDYLGGGKILERREYKVVALDETTAKITMTATTSASEGISSSSSSVLGMITLPLGARGVPSLDMEGQGSGHIYESREAIELTTTSKLTVRPPAR